MKKSALTERRVTIYLRGEMFANYHKVEASAYAVSIEPYAQYPAAVRCGFRPKGCRRARGIVQTFEPSLLVLHGWGHPDPAPMMTEYETQASGAEVRCSRFTSCSPEWKREFDAMIDRYLEGKRGLVVADYRGHDSHQPVAA